MTGLRGGRFDYDYDSFGYHSVVHLDEARFVRSVAVTGRSRWTYVSNRLQMSIDVDGPGALSGHLRADGTWGSAPLSAPSRSPGYWDGARCTSACRRAERSRAARTSGCGGA